MCVEKWWNKIGERAANVRLVTITPMLARDWLARNKKNRSPKRFALQRLILALQLGEMLLNGETVVFDTNGNLINGQHRLLAVIETNIPFQTYVVFDVDHRAFSTYDQHTPRSGADALSTIGQEECKSLAAIARKLHCHLKGISPSKSIGPEGRASNTRVLELVDRFPELGEAVRACGRVKKIVPASIAGYVYFIASKIDKAAADELFQQIEEGEGLQKGMPALTFRNRMVDDKASTARLSNDHILVFLIKTWNAFITRQELRILRWPQGEDWPKLYGDNLWGSEKSCASEAA